MFKDFFSKVKKEYLEEKSDEKKKIENYIFFIILLVIVVIVINYILSDKNVKSNNLNKNEISDKVLANTEIEQESLENKLEKILVNIKGVGKVKVLITYSQSQKTIPVYNEDMSTSITEEDVSGGGKRTVNELNNKKEVVYDETGGKKTMLVQSVIEPTIEGAIITAEGANDAQVKSDILQAVEAATGLDLHKIQVFLME